jgi:hypothetical protein
MKFLETVPKYLKALYLATVLVFLIVGGTAVQAQGWPHGCCGDSSDCVQSGYICCNQTNVCIIVYQFWEVHGFCADAAWNCELTSHY